MRVESNDLKRAVKSGLITDDQARQLWLFWRKEQEDTPHFQMSHVLYYFGGLLAISAVTLFVTQAWEQLRGFPLFILSSFLILLGLFSARYFLNKKLPIPAGIMSTFSLVLIPLAVYNIQISFGWLPLQKFDYSDFHYWVNWYWVPMELVTLTIGVIMLYLYQFPFLLFPISVTLWYMSMDLVSLFFHVDYYSWRAAFSLYFGLVVIMSAIYMDFKHSNEKKDYAAWLYIFGVLTFWGGLTCQDSTSEISKFFYLLINVAMILVSVFLNRRVFAVFGAFGVLGYLGHLSFTIFANSLGFPIVLVFLGILIIFAATRWPRMEKKLIEYFHPYIPRKILDRRRY